MPSIIRHITCSIEYLLSQSDESIGAIFLGAGSEIRKELEQRQDQGELLIGSEGCEGFDPVTGCPGHPVK